MNKQEIVSLVQKKRDKRKQEELAKIAELFNAELKKGIEITKDVKITNFSELTEAFSFEFPKTFTLDNPEDIAEHIKIPEQKEFPKSFTISNVQDIAKYIKIPEPKFPKEFKISNFPEIKQEKIEFPENVKKLALKTTEHFLSNIYERIGKFAKSFKDGIFISNKNPNEAIPVRWVDKAGKEFTEFKHIVTGIPAKLGISNTKGEQINPATEETLQKIVGAIATYNYVQSDTDATYKYYGFASSTGWKFKRKTLATGVWQVASDTGDYDTNWANRATKTYLYT